MHYLFDAFTTLAHSPAADSSFLLASAQIVDYPIVCCDESFCKISGYNRAQVGQGPAVNFAKAGRSPKSGSKLV